VKRLAELKALMGINDYWRNKVVLVTGGSAGLGKCLGRAFADAGAQVVLAARRAEPLRQSARELAAGGGRVSGIEADITQPAAVEHLVAETVRQFGGLDVLVNSAGLSDRGEILATSPDRLRELWELNFLAVARCTLAAAPHLLQAQGHLINIGSLASKVASRYLGAYPTSKFPLDAYCQQLRWELGPRGVKVLLVCPGPIRRADAGERYAMASEGLPPAANQPGAGVKVSALDPDWLSGRILRAAELGRAELVVPSRARWLFAVARLSPSWGDWIIRRMT
jgi:short-subunit dehydrogenase